MNAKEALGDARWSRVRLDALLERRRWCMQMSDYRSGGGSQALEKGPTEGQQTSAPLLSR